MFLILCKKSKVMMLLALASVVINVSVCMATDSASISDSVDENIVIDADVMDYDNDTGWVEAKGRVLVRKKDQELRAVYVRVNTKTEEVYAAGNIHLKYAGADWKGKVVAGSLKTGIWDTGEAVASFEPFRMLESTGTQVQSNGYFVMHGTTVTTCTNAYHHCHYHLKAKKIAIKPEIKMKGWGGQYYMFNIPVLYLPYWKIDLRPDFGWRIYPGHSSRLGSFLLSSYRYRMSPVWRGETHIDYMSDRGIAFGQDLKWSLERGIPILGISNGAGYGDIQTYFLDDDKPIDDDEDASTSDIDESRYRILLRNRYTLTERDYTMLNANYLSDTDVLEDFFEDEYRVYHTPDNYFIYGHNADNYSVSMALRFRLNDFFDGVNKLPELAIDFMPQQISDTDFFYEGRTSIGNMERLYAEANTNSEAYSVIRFDTWHEFSTPQKYFGFLNVIPRVNYRGTYYSETYDTTETSQVVAITSTNNITQTITNVIENTVDDGAAYRSVFGLGAEVSFKSFKQWGGADKPRRHVVEPYANYTFVPEPDVLPGNIYNFDSIDEINEYHQVRIGARNKLQKKIKRALGYSPCDILDVDIYTQYNLDAPEGADALTDIWMDLEYSPIPGLMIESDARYNLSNSELTEFNIRGYTSMSEAFRTSLEWRYYAERRSLLSADIALFENRAGWSPSLYARYEAEESRLEEIGIYLRKTFDCMVFRTGVRHHPGYTRTDGSETEDEYRATFELWLRAFPEFGMKRKDSSSRY